MSDNAMTVQIDQGEFKLTLTSTPERLAVNCTGIRNQSIANYMVSRSEVPRMDLLLSGIEAWSKELFTTILASRGESIASLQADDKTGK